METRLANFEGIPDGLQVKLIETAATDWKTSFGPVFMGKFNKLILLNVPDTQAPSGQRSPGLFGDTRISGTVLDAAIAHIGNVSQIMVVSSEDNRAQQLRQLLAAKLDKFVARQLGQRTNVPESAPIANFDKASLGLETMGLRSESVVIEGAPTRASIVAAIESAVMEHAGLVNWDAFVELFNPRALNNPMKLRYNPFVRPNYGRRTRIDMASRYMRQQPWMFPTR
jgi:hypothetical protein